MLVIPVFDNIPLSCNTSNVSMAVCLNNSNCALVLPCGDLLS